MAPVVGIAAAIGGAAVSAGGALWVAAAKAPLTAAALGIGTGVAIKSAKEAEKARESMKEIQQGAQESAAVRHAKELEFQKKSAGEYYKITREQMELQAQQSNIDTLANLIALTREGRPQQQTIVYTTPAAKTVDPLTKINQAIANFLGA